MQLETCSYPNMFPRNLSAVEDNMAWSLIGQAVRHSYLLRLDKASFRETAVGESQELENRNLLAWICAFHGIPTGSLAILTRFSSCIYIRSTDLRPYGTVILVPWAIALDEFYSQ